MTVMAFVPIKSKSWTGILLTILQFATGYRRDERVLGKQSYLLLGQAGQNRE